MGKCKTSQILVLSLIVVLLSFTPFLSTSIRLTHLYIVINILILSVGAQAGLLSAFPKTPDEEKKSIATIVVPKNGIDSATNINSATKTVTPFVKEFIIKKQISTDAAEAPMKVKMCCPIGPSIFFISSEEIEVQEEVKDVEEGGEEVGNVGDELAEQEISTKADIFISNFYQQLKMQREEL